MDYVIYTDGAYSYSRDKMGIGLVILKKSKLILKYSKMFIGGTNNQAELLAIIISLKLIKRPINSLLIISDSMYCIGCISLGWKREKNVKFWELFDKEFTRVKLLCPNIEFKHTRGHQNNNSDDGKWNNIVDKLAKEASYRI